MDEKILEITKRFHDTYEKLSKEYGYETRKETKVFDINSNNGKLMYATVNEIVSPILKENQELKKLNEEKTKIGIADHKYASKCEDKVIVLKTQQKEFIKYLEDEIKSCELVCNLIFNRNKDMKIYKEIFQKYQEIIGEKDEKK